VIAAISLSGPSGRIANGSIDELTVDVVDTARLISTQLGYKD
jgi:DNA-binding IclR family transcriptional regulator